MKQESINRYEYLMSIGLVVFSLFLPVSIAATQSLLVLLMLIWILKIIAGGNYICQSNYLNKPILVFVLLTIVSLFFSVAPVHSLKGLKQLSLVLIFFLIVNNVKTKNQVKKMVVFFIIGSVIVSLQGITQYLLGVNTHEGQIVSYPEFLAGVPESLLRFVSMLDGRIIASRGHPLTLAEGLMFGISMGIPLLLIVSGKKRLWISFAILVIGIALVFTFSRFPWIATFLIIVFILLLSFARFKKIVLIVGVILLAIIVTSGSISLLMKGTRQSIIERATNLWDQERIYMWQGGINIIKHYPLWGVGMKNIAKVYPEYAHPQAKWVQNWGELHNNFIHIAAERGIFTVLAFLWIIIGYFIYTFKFYWKIRKEGSLSSVLTLGFLASFIGFIITGMTEYNFGDSEIVMMLWFVMGLTIVVKQDYDNNREIKDDKQEKNI